jgi:hypothetical protein
VRKSFSSRAKARSKASWFFQFEKSGVIYADGFRLIFALMFHSGKFLPQLCWLGIIANDAIHGCCTYRTRPAESPPGKPCNHAILDCLGAGNAKWWEAIEPHCNQKRVVVDKQDFPQGFLAETSDGDIFIGSCSRVYFIIQNRDGAVVAADFYRVRIARQQQHLTHLENSVRQPGWPAI